MTTNEKIAALRAAAKAAGADGVLLMTSDPHCSEYLPDYYNALPWFSGFTGENSTLVVNQHTSALLVRWLQTLPTACAGTPFARILPQRFKTPRNCCAAVPGGFK